jgi:hypothetical protein
MANLNFRQVIQDEEEIRRRVAQLPDRAAQICVEGAKAWLARNYWYLPGVSYLIKAIQAETRHGFLAEALTAAQTDPDAMSEPTFRAALKAAGERAAANCVKTDPDAVKLNKLTDEERAKFDADPRFIKRKA